MKLLQQEYSNFSFSASEAFRKKSTRTNRIRTKRDRIYVVKRTQTVINKGTFALNEFALFEHRTKREVAVCELKHMYPLWFSNALPS